LIVFRQARPVISDTLHHRHCGCVQADLVLARSSMPDGDGALATAHQVSPQFFLVPVRLPANMWKFDVGQDVHLSGLTISDRQNPIRNTITNAHMIVLLSILFTRAWLVTLAALFADRLQRVCNFHFTLPCQLRKYIFQSAAPERYVQRNTTHAEPSCTLHTGTSS
jgi:hypothetical protein